MSAEPAPSRVPRWVWIFPGLLGLGFFAMIYGWILLQTPPDSGLELGYRFLMAEDPAVYRNVLRHNLQVAARQRLLALKIRGADARIENDQLILVLPGATSETVTQVKRLFRVRGLLELSPVAPIAIQQRYNEDQVVPVGYRVIDNVDRARGGEYEAYGARILVRKQPVIENRHITAAEPRQELVPGGARWVTTFEMDAEGTRLFDDAAAGLYAQRPHGLIAILLDGVLKSAPAVQSPAFHGKAQISGAKTQEDATDLAIVLRSGALPLKLGEPEFERPFGPPKK